MIPRRTLFPILVLVLGLHALVLGGASASSVRPGSAEPPQAFQTRTIALAATEPAAAPAASARPKAAAPARRVPVAKQARPQQAPDAVATDSPRQLSAPAAAWAAPTQDELLALGASAQAPTEPLEPVVLASAAPVPEPGDAAQAAEPAPAPVKAAQSASPPVQLPPPARLDFEVTGRAKGFGYSATAELLWQHDATSYSAHQEIKVVFLGSRSQSSVGSVTPQGLQPRRFGDRSRSERAAHFDFAAGQVTFSANTPAAPIAPGAQDRLSVFLQLGGMLAAAPNHYPPGTEVALTTVSARAADVWTFTVEGEQSLDLPMGTLRAVELQRLPRRDYDQKAQVWLAPSLGYLPVRIRLTEASGDFAELNLRSHEAP